MDNQNINELDQNNLKQELFRYISFWPFFLISVIILLTSAYLYIRYATFYYKSTAKIEIIDKAQDSEMSLPTAMTIFNRSMINVANEIGVLSSYNLHEITVKESKFNIKYFTKGIVKTTQDHFSDWLKDYELDFLIDTNEISNSINYEIILDDSLIIHKLNDEGEISEEYTFPAYDTTLKTHDLPFNLIVDKDSNPYGSKKILSLQPVRNVATLMKNLVNVSETTNDSDQLLISLDFPNPKISNDYINTLINQFDNDGITDRQLVYKRTIEFVDSRFSFLSSELESIELRKQNFKKQNNFSDIRSDADINVTQKISYDSEIFSKKSQLDLANLLKEGLLKSDQFDLMPINIGINNSELNLLINDYNKIISERERLLYSLGSENPAITNNEKKLNNLKSNVFITLDNYISSLSLALNNLESKENEYDLVFSSIPENEKILRSIERELEVKESLFLLLLQKREEASINFAVIKPSIKIIDKAMSDNIPVSPDVKLTYLSALFLGFFIPFLVIYIWFALDTKIHTKDQLLKRINGVPVIGEIPHIKDKESINKIFSSESRDPISESIRMVTANLNFLLFDKTNESKNDRNNIILVTSSIKGEGKTVVSTNLSSILSSKYDKILLVGADLRNPQIHKYLNLEKSVSGLSDYIYSDNVSWRDNIIKNKNLDIILSGTIPPNPTELLASKKFENFIKEVKELYDYVVIDSAPCLLVSDTFEISKYVGTTLYVVRSNYSDKNLCQFISECKAEKKLSNIGLILNAVGNSRAYGYQYGYQYGYKYGYKYSYNYGYQYGYSADND